MVTTFHSREVRSSTFCNSVKNILLSRYCACVETYPSCIAGVLGTFYLDTLRVSQFCIVSTDPPILDKLYRKFPTFEVGPFWFRITDAEAYASFPDYSLYITYEGVTVPFYITILDVPERCGSRCSINLVDFMWMNTCAFKLYAVCVPLTTPTVFYLRHHRVASEGWTSGSLCAECSEKFKLLLQPYVGNCTNTYSCRCNVCLRQPPSLRDWLPKRYSILILIYEFTLTSRTLYPQYLNTAETGIVSDDMLVPLKFTSFHTTFVRDKRQIGKRFHVDCVIPCDRYWCTYQEPFATRDEAIATLCHCSSTRDRILVL